MEAGKILRKLRGGGSPFFAVAATTLIALLASIGCLSSSYFIIFQNLFYIPIIIACVYYTKRGLVFSLVISGLYFSLILAFTHESTILLEASVRSLIFALVAGIVTLLSVARGRTEEELEKNRELLFEMTSQIPGVVYQFYARPNGEKGIYYVSEGAERIFGLPAAPEDFFDRFVSRIVPGHRESFLRSIDEAVREMREFKYEGIFERLSGGKVWFSAHSTPFRRSNEIVFNGIIMDITERKRAEELLWESENRYRNIFASSRDAIMTIEPPSWKFTSGNPATLGMFKAKDEEEFLVCDPWKLSPELQPDGRPSSEKAKEMIGKAVREGSHFFEWVHKRVNGEIFFAEVLLSRIDLGGKVFLQAVVRDITERKATEREIRRAELLKHSSEIKSKFTLMVSHELRSPLAVIKEALSVVLDEMAGNISDEQKKILGMAKTNADRLGRLINNVLDFQKIESGKMEYDMADHDIREVIQEASESLRVLAVQKGLNFRVESGDLLPKVKFDRDKFIQVVTNLAGNAIKFTEKGGVTVSLHREHNEIHVQIRDTGPGIKAEDIPRLFQPFEQLDQEGGRVKGGTGLGLAISREIILAHHGKIWAESQLGSGTVLHFTLPL
ncbi:MAG: PAS domain-containing sensor histidine kinase [Candidatus Omnitrophota bacterium]